MKLNEDVPWVILYLERKKKKQKNAPKIAKRKVELKEKTWKCKAEGRRCAWGNFIPWKKKKKQKNAPWNCFRDDFFAGEPKQLDTSCLWYSIKCQTRGVPEVICAKRHTTTCVSRHIHVFKVAARLVPPNNPISARALSLGPRLSLFSGVSYKRLLPNKRLLSDKRPLYAV